MLRGRPAAIILVAATMLFFAVIGPGPVDASQYLGQVSWTWHKTMNELGPTDKTETITASLFFIGGSSYELVGGSVETNNGNVYFSGSAVLTGSDLIMTISGSQDRLDGTKQTGIFHGQVDKTSFSGTGWAIKKRFDPTSIGPNPVFIDKYEAGTLTLVGNPPPLGPASTAPLSLLLND
jgi:hypothetical protein